MVRVFGSIVDIFSLGSFIYCLVVGVLLSFGGALEVPSLHQRHFFLLSTFFLVRLGWFVVGVGWLEFFGFTTLIYKLIYSQPISTHSEDEDAPSPLTRRLSTLNLARRSSASSILTTGISASRCLHQQQHPLSRSYSSGALLESEHRKFDTSYDLKPR